MKREGIERLLLGSARSCAICVLDLEGKIVFWNRGAERLLGWTEQEILGHGYSEFFLAEDLADGKPGRELEQLKTEGQFKQQARRCRKDGSYFWADITAFEVLGSEGDLCGFAEIIRDISEAKRTELNMARKMADLELALEAAQVYPWKWDVVADKVFCSDYCMKLFGIRPGGDLKSIHFLQSAHPKDRERVDMAVQNALELKTPYRVKLRWIWEDGSIHWICAMGRTYYDDKGTALLMAGVAFEITPMDPIPAGEANATIQRT